MIVTNCLPYQLIQTEVKIVNPAYVMTRENYNSKPCPAVTPLTHIYSTDACMLCVRDSDRPAKFHRVGVAKMSACMKHMRKKRWAQALLIPKRYSTMY